MNSLWWYVVDVAAPLANAIVRVVVAMGWP
jgi:hypothetical protein